MTKQWQTLIGEIEQLSTQQQDELADFVADELKWNSLFKNSGEVLLKLAEEALEEFQSGETKPVDVV